MAGIGAGTWQPWVTNLVGTGATLRVTDTNALDRPRPFYGLSL
jgi:hypothetical protein